ncbi:MAG: orotidine-5'-phosphate decarboxylase [Microbacterium sp.]
MIGFGERAREALGRFGSLCVGIDPHAALLAQWGLGNDAAGCRELALRAVDAAGGEVGFVKPQVAFFERHGAEGFAALEETIAAARAAGIIVIADAKRGDIGSTMDAYADAWLSVGSPLEADAVTASPYLGVGALDGTFGLAARGGKGVFVLAATSNPEATIQRTVGASGRTLAADVIAEVCDRNAGGSGWGDIGVVIGATVDWAEAGIAPFDPSAPILGPGFGTQGAKAPDLVSLFGPMAGNVIASESRSILEAGPSGIAERIIDAQRAYRHALIGADA